MKMRKQQREKINPDLKLFREMEITGLAECSLQGKVLA